MQEHKASVHPVKLVSSDHEKMVLLAEPNKEMGSALVGEGQTIRDLEVGIGCIILSNLLA